MKKKLFLLEDDIALNQTIVDYFKDLNYDIIVAYDGTEALNLLYENSFDLLLLDVNVPNINGFEILKKIRDEQIYTPAIFITSLNAMSSLEEGFDSGCDDYIKKPFALKELLIRVETILKREFFHKKDNKIKIDEDIYYDIKNNKLYISDTLIQLSQKESILLKLFLQQIDQIVSHDMIYKKLWNYEEVISQSALRTYIKNLRKYIGKEKIVSIKKLGYRFTTK
jgi:DNA-binding response OmpR family regulator